MNENISRLMDGEVDAQEFDLFCADMKSPEAMNAWICYHVIGDQLRGAHGMSAGFATRFRAALVAEPTMLAPGNVPPAPPYGACGHGCLGNCRDAGRSDGRRLDGIFNGRCAAHGRSQGA